jgi:hypothetical protein
MARNRATIKPRRVSPKEDGNLTVASFVPHRVPIASDPPPRERSIVVHQVFTNIASEPLSGGYTVTPAVIMQAVPGAAFWSRLRVEKISIWGQAPSSTALLPNPSNSIVVNIPTDTGWFQPPMQWVDDGVAGQSRPKIAFKLGLLERARFFTPADTTTLCTVSAADADILCFQYSLELVSPTLA